jgi:subtilisin family serine protease
MSFTRSLRGRDVCVLFLVLVSACADQTAPGTSAPAALSRISGSAALSVPGSKHLVHFTSDAVPSDFASRVSALGGSVDASYGDVGIAVVAGLSAPAAQKLAATPGVSAVDPDNVFQFLDGPSTTVTMDATSVGIASPSDPTTAFFYSFQWNLRAIGADAAWAAGQLGSPSVKVAIIDTGIDYLHPDLVGRVDLAHSASFVPAEDPFVPIIFPGRLPFTDLHFHGTHVAATVSSNAVLAAGVTSQTTLMAVKVIDVNGNGTTSAFLAGIAFAADGGANIINISLGVADLLSRKDAEVKAFQRMTDRVFRYAHKRGAAVIVAAGNERQDLDTKHTFKPYCGSALVTCVSATGPTSQASDAGPWENIDAPAVAYTNFGQKSIDVAAPGGNGTTPVWGACSTTSLVLPPCRSFLLLLGLQGTSEATPHASGTAALILSAQGPMPPSELRERLLKSADDLLPKGKDDFYGRGRISVINALGLN